MDTSHAAATVVAKFWKGELVSLDDLPVVLYNFVITTPAVPLT